MKNVIENIKAKAKKIGRPVRLMELCGTHSGTIAEHGIKKVMPENIALVSGPGCPVCVTDKSDIDVIVGLALSGISMVAYGDTLRVPGNVASLEDARRNGADVRVVYSVSEAVAMKEKTPGLVFFGLGFETTTGMTAWAIRQGLVVYSAHKLFPPAMAALLANSPSEIATSSLPYSDISRGKKIDGFINPGHVSAIIGTQVYQKFKIPQVVAGFSGEDVLLAIDMLLTQIIENKAVVENAYSGLVRKEGNKKALKLISEVFEVCDARWRGLGEIKNSGLKIRNKYRSQDAGVVHKKLIDQIKKEIKPKPSACKCGLVLQGLIEPIDCPLFGKTCTPDNPQGACMVSVEGSCNVEYRYNN